MSPGDDEDGTEDRRVWTIPGCSSPNELRYAFVNLHGHPRGELMLESLVAAGFVPRLVLSEESAEAVDLRKTQAGILGATPGFVPATPAEEICATRGVPFLTVADHNDARSIDALRDTEIDLVVLGDTRLVRPEIIAEVPHGIVNVHPGVIPEVRGNNPYIWAVIHGLPQGATAHLINAGVDRGPVLQVRRIPSPVADDVPGLIRRINELCAEIVVSTLDDLVSGRAIATPQPPDERLTFRKARPEIWSLATQMLAERAAKRVAA